MPSPRLPRAKISPPPPLFTLDDRFAAANFSPDPTASDLLVASSPSPRAAASLSPSRDLSRGKASTSAPGSPMDGVMEPPRKEVLALPPPSSPSTPPRPPAVEAQSPVMARTELAASGGEVNGEEWVTVFGFSPGDTNLVLREFEKCGVILRHHSGPRDGNWIHILYQGHRLFYLRKSTMALIHALPTCYRETLLFVLDQHIPNSTGT